MEISSAGLRALQRIAESGSFTAAADRLGFTQSAISRQAASLEREAGVVLFDRHPDGVHLTPAGLTLLRHARTILATVDALERDLLETDAPLRPVRLGVIAIAGATYLPRALTRLAEDAPHVTLSTREGTTPSLTRALRAGAIDLAVLTSRPPHRALDGESPALHVTTLEETHLAVAAATERFADRASIHIDELLAVPWIASPSRSGDDSLLGVWPGLPGRARIVHSARDWFTKLQLVAAGAGVTTLPTRLAPLLPPGVVLLHVEGAPAEIRSVRIARLPGEPTSALRAVEVALQRSV
ncbi:LysR family transcriptional regulator [Streptomyces sp. NPDC088788]|uniref:LysR family transcriptional regulator n=1 Tax=Streptomyces sp. NPDC088788 TaxID=3365898 RepID=UPI0038265463